MGGFRGWAAWGALGVALAAACGGGEQAADEAAHRYARARGAVVAKIDGTAIGVEQVSELVASTGLPPREALARLEEEYLLAREAQRRGYGRSRAALADEKRALVETLLKGTVEQLRAEDLPADEVHARFEAVAPQMGLPLASFAQHEPAVRAQLLLEKRKEALERLTKSLRDSIGVKLSEPEVQKLLSDPAFWREGP
jgi:hypothetical protein